MAGRDQDHSVTLREVDDTYRRSLSVVCRRRALRGKAGHDRSFNNIALLGAVLGTSRDMAGPHAVRWSSIVRHGAQRCERLIERGL